MFVYILKSETTGKYYCGKKQDIYHRLTRHNNGLENYTKSDIPWVLFIFFEVNDRSEALLLGKKRGIQRYLQDNNLTRGALLYSL